MQAEIDAGGDPTAGDEIAVDDNPALVRDRAEPAEELTRSPMGGCALASEQARSAEQERPGTHRGDKARAPGDRSDRIDQSVISEQLEYAGSTWNTEHVEFGTFLERGVGPQFETPLGLYRLRILPEQLHRSPRHPAKHFVRPGEIELRDLREQQEPNPMGDCHDQPRSTYAQNAPLRRMIEQNRVGRKDKEGAYSANHATEDHRHPRL